MAAALPPDRPSTDSPTPTADRGRVDDELLELTLCAVLGESEALVRAAERRAPRFDRRWREALLQVHLFAGFPRLVEAAGVLARAQALGQVDPDEAALEPDNPERGAALFDAIYAAEAPRVRASLRGFHPDLAAWIEGHAYGRVLSRPGLEPFERELLAVAALAVTHQERQLASHVRGARRLGASAAELRAVLDYCAPRIATDRRERIEAVLARFNTVESGG